ncbi:hypothetical protein DSO57_1026282 [Entomophthora muscae]|uniref:Uncharacterized protein n=1 Tax=Entomophthora muscae TaxID=34485 RepID=A0ACC2TNX3_9FUNG|nr:hypothetical protein DSO57_1026282 [Entomophthora muscae]
MIIWNEWRLNQTHLRKALLSQATLLIRVFYLLYLGEDLPPAKGYLAMVVPQCLASPSQSGSAKVKKGGQGSAHLTSLDPAIDRELVASASTKSQHLSIPEKLTLTI